MNPCDFQPAASWRCRSGGPWLRALVLVAALATSVAFAQDKPLAAPLRQLSLAIKSWQGDFDQMLQLRLIRVLIPYSRTLFFNDNGRERGITAENVRDCERYLNQKYAKQLGQRPLTVFLIPTPRDKLFLQLNAGLGDIAAGDLTETEERLKLVDFVVPKDATPVYGNSSSATLVQSRNSVGRAVTSGNRTLAIRGAPCMGDTAYHQA